MFTNQPRQVTNQITYTQVVIPAEATESELINLPSQASPTCIYVPANFSGDSLRFLVQMPYGGFIDFGGTSGDNSSITIKSVPFAVGILPTDLLSFQSSFKIVMPAQAEDCVFYIQGRTFL